MREAGIRLLKEPRPIGNGYVDRLGYAKRHVAYHRKEIYDYTFAQYCESINYEIKTKYGIARGNHEAGLKGFMKYDRAEPEYSKIHYMAAEKMLNASYACLKKARLVSDFEKYFDRTTSPGYPWNLIHPKKDGFLRDHDCVIYMNRFIDSKSPHLMFASNIVKEEPKKLVKIENNDLRVICSMAAEHTALGNHLFGEMNETMYQAAPQMKLASLVGHSKYHLGWDQVFRRLKKHPNGMDFDFITYDASVDQRSFQTVKNLRLGLYARLTPEIVKKVHLYYFYVVHTVVVLENGDIYCKHTGNNSGQTNTITDNNIVNELRWMYAWCILAPSEDWWTLEKWKSNVELIVQGDDCALTVSDAVKEWFNPTRISEVFSKMNWVGKMDDFSFKPVEQLEFCSLRFQPYSGHYVPCPAHPDKILTSMLRNSRHSEVRFSLLRALALRMDCFFHKELFNLFDGYVQYVFQNFDTQLHGYDDVTYEDLLSNYKSVPQLLSLYLTPSR